MTTQEKKAVRRLAEAYTALHHRDTKDVDSANADIDNAVQDLPWKRQPGRAAYLEEIAWRYSWLRSAKRG